MTSWSGISVLAQCTAAMPMAKTASPSPRPRPKVERKMEANVPWSGKTK